MRKWIKLLVCVVATSLSCPMAYGLTLTFDEVPSGTGLLGSSFYVTTYRVWFASPFQAVDHTDSTWGPQHSGTNVLAWDARDTSSLDLGGLIDFGYFTGAEADPDDIRSVGAYFSTQPGVMIAITAYHYTTDGPPVSVANVVIGGPAECWKNQFVEISSPNGPFSMLEFRGVKSPNDLLGFCLDDMTITPVPEPPSLAALICGLAGVGGVVIKRRR